MFLVVYLLSSFGLTNSIGITALIMLSCGTVLGGVRWGNQYGHGIRGGVPMGGVWIGVYICTMLLMLLYVVILVAISIALPGWSIWGLIHANTGWFGKGWPNTAAYAVTIALTVVPQTLLDKTCRHPYDEPMVRTRRPTGGATVGSKEPTDPRTPPRLSQRLRAAAVQSTRRG